MSVTALTSNGHVDALTSGYKRSFNSIGPVAVGEFKRPASMPASALRNDRGTNATLSVARCCSIPLYPGEVAFVRTGQGSRSLGEGTNFIPIVSLSQINEMLLDNPVTPMSGAGNVPSNLLTTKVSKSVFATNWAVPLQYAEFDPVKMTDDLSHPLHAYALDGVVCSASDSRGGQGDRRGYTTREEAAGCNVAVGGQSPLVAVSMKGQAARMTSRVYVVLVANRVVSGAARPRRATPHSPFITGASAMNQSFFSTDAATTPPYGTSASSMIGTEWVFQYELVTSAELDIDPAFRKFKVQNISTATSNRVPVKMWQLGVVTDLNSGNQSLPTQFTVSVNVRPFHGVETRRIKSVDGKILWVKLPPSTGGPRIVFFPPTKAELREQKSMYMLPASAYFRRMRGHRTCFDRGMAKNCGFTTAVTGPSASEFKLFEDKMKRMQDAFQNKMNAQLKDAKIRLKAAEDAAKAAADAAKQLTNTTNTLEVDKKIKEVSERVAKHDAIIEEVKASVENVRQASRNDFGGLREDVRKVNTVAKEAAKRVDGHVKIMEKTRVDVEQNSKSVQEAIAEAKEAAKAANAAVEAARSADDLGQARANDNEVTNKQALERTKAVEEKFRKLEKSVLDNNKNGINSLREIQELKVSIGIDWEKQKTAALAVLQALRADVDKLQGGVGPMQADINKLSAIADESMIEIKRQLEELTASNSGSKEKETELTKELEKLQADIKKLSAIADEKNGDSRQLADNLNDRVKAFLDEMSDVEEFNTIQKTYYLSIVAKVETLLDDAFSDPLTESDIKAKSAEAQRYFTMIAETKEIEYQLAEVLTQYPKIMDEIEEAGGSNDPRIVYFLWLRVAIQEKVNRALLEKVETLLKDAFSETLAESDIEAKSKEVEEYYIAFNGSEASEKELGELLTAYAAKIKEYKPGDPYVVHFQWLAELYPYHDEFV